MTLLEAVESMVSLSAIISSKFKMHGIFQDRIILTSCCSSSLQVGLIKIQRISLMELQDRILL